MTPWELVLYLTFLGLAAGVLWYYVFRVFWRGQVDHHAHTMYASLFFFSPPARRGIYRSLPLLAAVMSVFFLGLALIVPGFKSGRYEVSDVTYVAAIFIAGALVLLFVGVPSIVLFNRPKFLVPPHLRNQVGLARIWLRAWRIRRATRHSKIRPKLFVR